MALYNLARMTTATIGNGATLTLGSAVPGFLTFAQAGVPDGGPISYGIIDGANSECGTSVYTASGTTMTRTVVNSTNANARIVLSGNAIVSIAPLAADFVPFASPVFTGDPQAPTAATGDNDTSIATTAFVKAQAYATLASPTFTGTPAAPTATVDTNTTQIATTAYVIGQASAAGDGTPAQDGTASRGTSNHYARADHIHPTDTSRAPLASPTFTGTPAAPTPASTDNSTTIATTAYVRATALGRTGTSWITPGGRLTISSGNPVMAATVTAATTVYWSPYTSNITPIYNGTDFILQQHAELSQATTDTTKSPAACVANSNYDVFVWIDAGTVRATRGPPWTSATARGTGAGTTELVRIGGLLMNANAITNGPAAQRGTYVGTFRTNGSSQVDFHLGGAASGGIAANIMIWNMYNRRVVNPTVTDNGATYTGAPSTWRQARGSTAMQVNFVVGVAEDGVNAINFQGFTTASAGGGASGLQLDGTTPGTPDWYWDFFPGTITSGSPSVAVTVPGNWGPVLGSHFIAAVECGMGANPTMGAAKLNASLWA